MVSRLVQLCGIPYRPPKPSSRCDTAGQAATRPMATPSGAQRSRSSRRSVTATQATPTARPRALENSAAAKVPTTKIPAATSNGRGWRRASNQSPAATARFITSRSAVAAGRPIVEPPRGISRAAS